MINYEYTYASGLAAAAAGTLDPGSFSGSGYMFYAPIYRADIPVDADTSDGQQCIRGGPVAKIGLPGNPTLTLFGGGTANALGDNEDEYQRYDANGGGQPGGWFYNFYCGANIVGPADAPAGDYTVHVYPNIRLAPPTSGDDSLTDPLKSTSFSGATPDWATTYTFKGMPAVSFGTVSSAPKVVIHVDLSGDTIAGIDFAWEIYDTTLATPGWRAMTDAEVVAYCGGSERGPGVELATNGMATRYELNAAGGVASGTLTAADIQGGGSFPAWSTVNAMHLNWVDFTGTNFGVDLR